jgi:enoyl-CoA hydratase/carnithine racemase
VKEYAQAYVATPRDYWKYMALFRAYIESILNTGKPVIARINGMAVGGGNESQLACDLSVIAQHAYLKQVGTHVGSVACGGATQWLPIAVGDRRAREMLFLNDPVPAEKALAWGLVNWVVPTVRRGDGWIEQAGPEEIGKAQKGLDGYRIDLARLDGFVDDLARRLLDSFPECARYTKQQTNLKDLAWHQTVRHARTGSRCTTPAGSRWKGCAPSPKSVRRATGCYAPARPPGNLPRRRGAHRYRTVARAARPVCLRSTHTAADAAHGSRNRRWPGDRPRDRRGARRRCPGGGARCQLPRWPRRGACRD